MNKQISKFIIFLIVGVSSAVIDVGSLYLLSEILFVNHTAAITIAFLLGLVFNYFCHTYITFSKSATGKNLVKYLIVVLINYLTTLGLIFMIQAVGFGVIFAKIVTLPIVAMITFVLSNKWVYK